MCLLRLSQGISSGCHLATQTPIFLKCHYFGKWTLCLLELAKVFLQGAATPPLHHFLQLSLLWDGGIMLLLRLSLYFFRTPPRHPYTIFYLSLLWEGGIMLLLRLSLSISSGCHHATPTPKTFFWICHYCWKGTLCFCYDLAMVFLQGATMPPLHHFLELSLFQEVWHYASAST